MFGQDRTPFGIQPTLWRLRGFSSPRQLCLEKWRWRILCCLSASPVVYISVISFSSRWVIHCWACLVMFDIVLCCLGRQFQPVVSHTRYPWRASRLWCIIDIVTHVQTLIITFVQLFTTLIMCNYHHGLISQLEVSIVIICVGMWWTLCIISLLPPFVKTFMLLCVMGILIHG